MSSTEAWELASYVVTVIGLPFGIGVFIYEQNRERQNEDEEICGEDPDFVAYIRKICNDSL